MSMIKYLALVCVISLYGLSNSNAQEEWTPDLSTMEGRLQFLGSMFQAHPEFTSRTNSYLANPIQTLANAQTLANDMGEEANNFQINPERLFGATFSTADDIGYSDERVQSFKASLLSDLEKIADLETNGLVDDLDSLSSDSDLAKRLLRLAPILYDGDGKPKQDKVVIDTVRSLVEGMDSAQLDDLYTDTLVNHQLPIVESNSSKYRSLNNTIQSFKNNFIAKDLNTAFTMVSSNGRAAKVRTITLQKIPTAVSLFRGCIGGDCSMQTVNFYSLPKGTDVFWIRKGTDPSSFPDGYVLVTEAKKGSKTIPYVVTVNGKSLGVEDTRMVLKLIAEARGSSELLVSDMTKNSHVMNTTPVRNGFRFGSGQQVEVEMTEGWNHVSNSKQRGSGTNYYRPSSLQNAVSVKIDNEEMNALRIVRELSGEAINTYSETARPSSMNLVERAILAVHSALGKGNTESAVLDYLDVSQAQATLVKRYMDLKNPDVPMTILLYESLNENLGFRVSDLAHGSMLTRGVSIGELYRTNPLIAEADEWQEISRSSYNEIKHQLLQSLRMRADEGEAAVPNNIIMTAIKNQFAIPDDFISDYGNDLIRVLDELDGEFRSVAFSKALETIRSQKASKLLMEWILRKNSYALIAKDWDAFRSFLYLNGNHQENIALRSRVINEFYPRLINELKMGDINPQVLEIYINDPHKTPTSAFNELARITQRFTQVGSGFDANQKNTFATMIRLTIDSIDSEEELIEFYNLMIRRRYYELLHFNVDQSRLLVQLPVKFQGAQEAHNQFFREAIKSYILVQDRQGETIQDLNRMLPFFRDHDEEFRGDILEELRQRERIAPNNNRANLYKECLRSILQLSSRGG